MSVQPEEGGGAVFDGCVFYGNEARGASVNSVYSGAGQVRFNSLCGDHLLRGAVSAGAEASAVPLYLYV